MKNDLIEYKYLCCNKSYQKKSDENLKKQFVNKYSYLLRKDVYPSQYMNDWKNFNETSLPEKEDIFTAIRDIART